MGSNMNVKLLGIVLAIAMSTSVIAVALPGEDAPLAGTVLNVQTGETFSTIQAAISDAETLDGHTIEVGAGLYEECITISKKLTVTGAERDTTTIYGTPTGTNPVVLIRATDVTFTCFTVTGGGSQYGIKAESSSNPTVQDIHVSDVYTCFWAMYVTSGLISNNIFDGGSIVVLRCDGLVVRDNICSSEIDFKWSINCVFDDNTATRLITMGWPIEFKDNILIRNTLGYIQIYISGNLDIIDNDIGYVLITQVTGLRILGNRFSGSPSNAMEIQNSPGCEISGNTLSGCDNGILLISCDGGTISRNTIIGCLDTEACGMSISSNNCLIFDNTVENNARGIVFGIYQSAKNNVIYHNNIINNKNQARSIDLSNLWYEPTLLEGNFWSDYAGIDSGGIVYAWDTTGKHLVAGDGIGDTALPFPSSYYDFYPFTNKNGWLPDLAIDSSDIHVTFTKDETNVHVTVHNIGAVIASNVEATVQIIKDGEVVQQFNENFNPIDIFPGTAGTFSRIISLEAGDYQVWVSVDPNDEIFEQNEANNIATAGFTVSSAMLEDLYEMIEVLPDDAFLKNPDQRRNALLNKVTEVIVLVESDDIQEAINKLNNDIRAKMDGTVGGNPKNDWVIDPEAQLALTTLIDEIVVELS